MSAALFVLGICIGGFGLMATFAATGFGALQGTVLFLLGGVLIGSAVIAESVSDLRRDFRKFTTELGEEWGKAKAQEAHKAAASQFASQAANEK